MDANEFRRRGHEAVERIARYYEDLSAQGLSPPALRAPDDQPVIPVLSQVKPGYLAPHLPPHAPESPEPWDSIQNDLETFIFPGITSWQHPQFHAFFPANSSFPGILGEMYSAMFSSIGFNWQTSPAYTELEQIVCNWVAKAIGLDDAFLWSNDGEGGGVIQGSASESIAVAIIAARQRMIDSLRKDETDDAAMDVASRLVAYGSTQTHSATLKGTMIAGVRFRALEADPVTFALKGDTLKAAIEEDLAQNLIPFYVTGTIGTTSSGAVDDVSGIVKAAAAHNLWVNVDAAWAGAALICPEYRELLAGCDRVDSFSFNMHKWLLTNFDCSPMWVRSKKQLTKALSVTPIYLRNAASENGLITDYRDWQLPLGRRFRALKAWFVLRTYGLQGLRSHIRKHISQCQKFEAFLEAHSDLFRIVTARSLSLITFAIIPPESCTISANELTSAVLDGINSTGEIFLSHTMLGQNYAIRHSQKEANTAPFRFQKSQNISHTDRTLNVTHDGTSFILELNANFDELDTDLGNTTAAE
ncbi:hypothetical protein HDU84_002263 [Entophlyctis sp. JEL0112]|nr:hypothetical protein HDU84_002263 [Entophlyctis sp. JEL0112]